MKLFGKFIFWIAMLSQSGCLLFTLLRPLLSGPGVISTFLLAYSQIPLSFGAVSALAGGFLLGLSRYQGQPVPIPMSPGNAPPVPQNRFAPPPPFVPAAPVVPPAPVVPSAPHVPPLPVSQPGAKAQRCPSCGRPQVTDGAFCAGCGYRIAPAKPTHCINAACRKPLQEGTRFCSYCGTQAY